MNVAFNDLHHFKNYFVFPYMHTEQTKVGNNITDNVRFQVLVAASYHDEGNKLL
jgi:hypothetical protein